MTEPTIREATPDDAAAFLAYLRAILEEPASMIPLAPDELRTVTEQAAMFAAHAAAANSVFLLAFEGDALVGNLNLSGLPRRALRHVAYLGMGVARSHRGRGLGTRLMREALAYADAHAIMRVELDVYVRNAPAIALYENCGFVIEGRRAKMVFVDGEYLDDLHMARVTVP